MHARCLSLTLGLVAAVGLAGCAAGDADAEKEIGELRTDLQRMRSELDKQREKSAALERRLNVLSDSPGRSRQGGSGDETGAPAASDAPAASATASVKGDLLEADAPKALDVASLKTYLTSQEGVATVASAVKLVQEQQEKERFARGIESALARLVKEASLTEDQTTKMRDIMTRTGGQIADMFRSARDGGMDMSPEARQQSFAKIGEIRQAADAEVKVVLSQTQYETYQKSVTQAFGGFGGFGGGPGGRGAGGNGGRGGNNN